MQSLATASAAYKRPPADPYRRRASWAWAEAPCRCCPRPKTYTNPHSPTACLASSPSTSLGRWGWAQLGSPRGSSTPHCSRTLEDHHFTLSTLWQLGSAGELWTSLQAPSPSTPPPVPAPSLTPVTFSIHKIFISLVNFPPYLKKL